MLPQPQALLCKVGAESMCGPWQGHHLLRPPIAQQLPRSPRGVSEARAMLLALTHSFTHSFIHSFILSLTHSFPPSSSHPFSPSSNHSFPHSFTPSFIHDCGTWRVECLGVSVWDPRYGGQVSFHGNTASLTCVLCGCFYSGRAVMSSDLLFSQCCTVPFPAPQRKGWQYSP